MGTTLPRGIQLVTWKNADKTKQVRYRVRIQRKDVKEDRLFDSLDEAKEFLALSKSVHGKEKIFTITDQQRREQELISDYLTSPPISHYFDLYLGSYFAKNPNDTELERRRKTNAKCFFNIIKNTEIEKHDSSYKGIVAMIMPKDRMKLGDFKIIDITPFEINSYIKERLKSGVKPISISRELTYLSVLFRKLPNLEPGIKINGNPALEYDKDLLKMTDGQHVNLHKKREFRLSTEDEEKLIKALNQYSNPELRQIVLLSLLTSMRRSEIITLRWDQVHADFIQLYVTKSKKPRKVFLTNQAKELLASIPRKDERLFHFTISGFEGSFYKFLEKSKLTHLRFHDFRRESISRFIEHFGKGSSVLVTEILGFQSIAKFEELYTKDRVEEVKDEESLKQHVGHSSKQKTKLYTVLKSNPVDMK